MSLIFKKFSFDENESIAAKIISLFNFENRSVVTECTCGGQFTGHYERFVADVPFILPLQLLADEICTEYSTAVLTELPPSINVRLSPNTA